MYCDIHNNTYDCICKDKSCNNILSTKYLDVYECIKGLNKLRFTKGFKILFKIPPQLNPINPQYFYAHNLSLIIEPLYFYSKFPTDIILLIGDYLIYTPNKIKNTSIKNIINKQYLIADGYYNTNPKNINTGIFAGFKNESETLINYSCSYKRLNINKKNKLNKNKFKNLSGSGSRDKLNKYPRMEPKGFFKNSEAELTPSRVFKNSRGIPACHRQVFKKLNVPIKKLINFAIFI